MKVKTSELIDLALDWAVAKCVGTLKYYVQPNEKRGTTVWEVIPQTRRYSSIWAQGGPIIEREEIGSFHYIHGFHGHTWSASIGSGGFQQDGPTPLIAAMRCYVASKLGDDVDVPEELL